MDKTVQAYTIDALRLCNNLGMPGRTPSTEAQNEVLNFFNQLIDSYNSIRNFVYSLTDLTFTLTSGQFQYTIGPGGQLNGPRPQGIQRANLIYQSTPQVLRLPIAIIDVDQWAAIRVPNLPSAIPLRLYYDHGYSQTNPTGLGTIYLWPGPLSAYQLELFIWNTLSSTAQLADTVFAPPGYARFLTYNLAKEIIALYPSKVDPKAAALIMQIADESKNNVLSLNSPSPIVQIDPALVGNAANGFNWLISTS